MKELRVLMLVWLMLPWGMSVQALTLPPLPVNEAFRTVMIDGEDLAMALGLPLQQLSLAAMIDDAFEPVPFQIDHYNADGAPYFSGWDVPMAGKAGVLNASDKLLFVFKDAGPRLPPRTPTDGVVLAEISLQDSQGNTRYVYLLRNARLRSEEQYVRYSAEMGLVETDFYSLRYREGNHLLWDDIQFPGFVGESPLDSMKLNVVGGAGGPLVRMTFDNDDMVARPEGAIIGPIRTTTQAEFEVYLVGVPLITLSLQIHHYPRAVIYDVRGEMPRLLRSVVYDPKVSMVLDFNNLLGAEIMTAADPTATIVVDGQVSDDEAGMLQNPLDPQQDRTWIRIISKRNLDTLSFLDYVGGFDEPLSLVLLDDAQANAAGERFPGHLPSLGYRVEQLPQSGPMGMVVSIYFSESFAGDAAQLAQAIRTQPEIRVRSCSHGVTPCAATVSR